LRILWDIDVAQEHPDVSLSIIATDVDKASLARAGRGCFEPTSLHELPPQLIEQAFDRVSAQYCVRRVHRNRIEFVDQDLRLEVPPRLFDLVLCRNLAFTYFALPLQRQVLRRMLGQLRPGGYFVIGSHEELPGDVPGLVPLAGAPKVFRKEATGQG
jgi:chemotaxis protein methyltransferase CheR